MDISSPLYPAATKLFCNFENLLANVKEGHVWHLSSSNCPLCLFTEPNHQGYHELKETTPFSHY